MRQHPEYTHQHQHERHVDDDLIGVECFGGELRMHRICGHWARGASFAEHEYMNRNEQKDRRREEKQMQHVKARERQRSHRCAAAQEPKEPAPNEGYVSGDIGADRAGEIRVEVPPQQISRKRHAQHEQREHTPGNPQ